MNGWVQACANGRVGSRYCLQGGCIGFVTEMVSSRVMYNFGGGPRGDPMNLAF